MDDRERVRLMRQRYEQQGEDLDALCRANESLRQSHHAARPRAAVLLLNNWSVLTTLAILGLQLAGVIPAPLAFGLLVGFAAYQWVQVIRINRRIRELERDLAAFEREHPDVVAAYRALGESRREAERALGQTTRDDDARP